MEVAVVVLATGIKREFSEGKFSLAGKGEQRWGHELKNEV